MPIRSAAALALALFADAVAPEPARAGATVDLLFVGVNGEPIAPTRSVTLGRASGDVLTMALVMTNDEPLAAAQFGLEFDLEDAELELLSASLWAGVQLDARNWGLGFRPQFFGLCPPDRALACSSASPGLLWPFFGMLTYPAIEARRFLPAGTYQMGTVSWITRDARSDGVDILATIHPALDGFGDAAFQNMNAEVVLGTASVLFNPEPGTALLLGLGLCALAAARRGRR